MTLPASGQISISQINTELGRASTAANTSLDACENGAGGGYPAINAASPSKPSGTNPASMSEWYSYDHTYTAVIPASKLVGLYNIQTCGTPDTTVYWDSAFAFSAATLYYDSGLTSLVTGFDYVVDGDDGNGYDLLNGVVGALQYNC